MTTSPSDYGAKWKHYTYRGENPKLLKCTAIGLTVDGVFKVQVDQRVHPWYVGWHETNEEEWLADE